MATQNLVEQTIAFVVLNQQGSYDQNAIFANSLIQSFIQNSAGSDVLFGIENYANLNAGVITYNNIFFLRGFIQPSFQATVQANIPALQSAFPQYTVVTWGDNVVFGN